MSLRLLQHNLNLNQRGAVVIEFAVVVLLLLLILFGILEFSFTFLQRHFVANAAREGIRIGVRAQNYNCFDEFDTATSCKNAQDVANAVYRKGTVVTQLTDCNTNPKGYLCTLYQSDMAQVVVSTIENPDETKTLNVTVTATNFFPPLISGLVPGYEYPVIITYSASGNYENAAEP
jgi:Flp pilus assembly protein TadG